MRKQLFNVLLSCLLVVPFMSTTADAIDEGQSTEGKDFWVTFMQADQKTSDKAPVEYEGKKYNAMELSLAISSREDCQVTISHPYTGFDTIIDVKAGKMAPVKLYSGVPVAKGAREKMEESGIICYAVNSETTDNCALHVTSDKNFSLFATNYKKATFDATNVLPTASLRTEYMVQTYTPSDHQSGSQGSHFAVVATEDSTVVTYILSASTTHHYKGDTVVSDTLKHGQVWYVWTGEGEGDYYDLSGTSVSANKPIAVFQGNPHTNIPEDIKERDHIFSQAMPTEYWGNTFVLTGSSSRHRDFVRIMALEDGTTVYINGDSVYSFDFANNPKQYWEFEFGDEDVKGGDTDKEEKLNPRPKPKVVGNNCLLTTNCPCAVHLFAASRQWDGNKNNNGDPSMLWVNPIEQQIDQITFTTYKSSNGTSQHYVNVVTDKPELMTLDGKKFKDGEFKVVTGSDSAYFYVQKELGDSAAAHTLKSDGSKFIAHVYGFTANESYGYSAGGATTSLNQSIYINGEEFSPEKENKLCGKDTVHFACQLDFTPDSIVWHFGDGTPDVTLFGGNASKDIPHYYKDGGIYDASCTIFRNSSNVCVGQSATTVINIQVNIGRYEFSVEKASIPCPDAKGVQGPGTIPYTSTIDLKGGNVVVDFNDAAKAAGFGKELLNILPDHFELEIPIDAVPGVTYGIMIEVKSDCGDTLVTLPFRLPVGNDVIDQRYSNVLGLLKDHPQIKGLALSDFQWYYKSDSTAIPGATSSVLNLYDIQGDRYLNDEYFVCYWINKGQPDSLYNCACAKPFVVDTTKHQFVNDPDSLIITASYGYQHGDKVFVNANWGGKTEIKCYAQWITTSGNIYKDWKFLLPDGGCLIDTPTEPDLYLLRVVTDKQTRSFKFIIQ